MTMTIAKVTGDGWEYLVRHTARGDTDVPPTGRDRTAYYTAAAAPPGRWTGRGAHLLGLEDGQEVTEQQMLALFGMGAHPDADAMIDAYIDQHTRPGMTQRQRSQVIDDAINHATLGRPFARYQSQPKNAVAGFDLTFSPVKSASVMWAVDDRPGVREVIRRAHQNAVRDALDFIEAHAAFTRTGKGGTAQIDTNGLIAATFEHWDSRAGDPDLHTHVAVANRVQGVDGKWRTLDAAGLYQLTVAASELYNTAFEAHLTAATGVTFSARPDTANKKEPVREIDGVPPEVISFFSQRRAAITDRYAELADDYRARHHRDPDLPASRKLAQQATLETRSGKKPPVSLADKRARWQEELTARFGPGILVTLRNAVPAEPPARVRPVTPNLNLSPYAERIVATVSARRATWTRWNLHAEAERLLRTDFPGIPPDDHRDLAERLVALALSPGYSISVEPPALTDEPAGLRRANGESVFTRHGAERFTSQAVLDAERRLLHASRARTANPLSSARTTAILDGFEAVTGTALDPGQRALVAALATDDRFLLAGIGPAGSGKTTAMRAYACVLQETGRRRIPLATSAASAAVLARELGLPAENLHKFAYDHAQGSAEKFPLGPGDVILIDEAGMAGTFLLDQVVSLAAAHGATVRLLGDHRQLSAVESGGALRLIASEPGTPELTVLHRFRDPGEAAATLRLRTGDPAALDFYTANNRIRSGSRDSMTTAAYDGWKADMLAGKTTMMAAADGADVTRLSARARADRIAAGQVESGGVILRDGNRAGVGDWIVTRRNDRRLSVLGGRDFTKNGDSWTVEQRHANGALTVRHLAHGGRVTLPAGYVNDHVQLLYASTAHRVQGGTVDTAHPLITPDMTREALYVLATRAKESTTLYVATHEVPFDEDAHVDQARLNETARPVREVLANILSNEGAATSATETIATAQQDSESLSTLIPRYQHAAQQLAARRRQGNPDTDDLAAYVAELADQINAQAAKQEPPRPRPAPRRPAPPPARRPARQYRAPLLAPPPGYPGQSPSGPVPGR